MSQHAKEDTRAELHFPCLNMRPNAANLDNLKHDKEQDDRKTIKGVRVQERASRKCGGKIEKKEKKGVKTH